MGRSDAQQREIDRATRTARQQLSFILGNAHALRRVRNGDKKFEAAEAFDAILKCGDELTPNQISYIDGIYEAAMKAMGLPSVGIKSDGQRRRT